MKLRNLTLLSLLVILTVSGCNQKNPRNLTLLDRTDSLSYVVGMGLAKDVQSRTYPVDYDMVMKGYLDGMDSIDILKDSSFIKLIEDFTKEIKKQETAQLRIEYDANIASGKKFLESIKLQPNIYELPSGMMYSVFAAGKGPKATEKNTVKVNYSIYTIDGQEKINTKGKPEVLIVSTLEFAGMKEGIQLMNAGSKYRFYIPSDLAFRDQLGISIPIGSTIIMDLELVEIL